MKKITDFLKQALPMIGEFGGTMIKALGQAIIDNAPAIMQAGRDLLKALASGLSAGLTAANIKIPKLSDIVSWILGKAADLSAQFKTWVTGIDWGKLSDDLAVAINAVPWTELGAKLGIAVNNIWTAIRLALFGGTVVTGGGTADMQTKVVKGIDWGALETAIWTAFSNAVVAGLTLDANATFKIKVLDVFAADSKLLQQMIDDYGTKNILHVAWQITFEGIFGLSTADAVAGLKANFAEVWQNAAGKSWSEFWEDPTNFKASLDFWKGWFETSLNIWGSFFATFWQTYFVDPFNYAITQIENIWIKLLEWYNTNVAIPLGWNKVPVPALPTSGTTKEKTATPTTTVRNQTTHATTASTAKAGGAKTVTNNVTINNPSAEPASASVEITMRRMNYLGFDA